MASLNAARSKARDAIRANDMHTIYTMLSQYSNQFGGIPVAGGGVSDLGGWDYSSQPVGSPNFLNFLVTSGIATRVPVDPINNKTGDAGFNGYAYQYYCYPGVGLALGYISEKTNTSVFYPRYQDPDWTCI